MTTRDGPRFVLLRANPVAGEEGTGGRPHRGAAGRDPAAALRRAQDDLVATVAHEFRTPLTSLRMAIHLCTGERSGRWTEAADLLFAAREDCERLQGFVDDLLDLSRIQGRPSRPPPTRDLLGDPARASIDQHRALGKERGG